MRHLIILAIALLVLGCAHKKPEAARPSPTGSMIDTGQKSDIEIHRRRGMEFRNKNQAARACEEFYALLALDPSDQGARAELVRLLVSRDHRGEALKVYLESEESARTAELLLAGAELYLALADFRESGKLLRKFKELNGNGTRQDVVLMEARVLIGEKKFDEAEKLLRRAVEKFKSPLARIDLATFLCNRLRFEEGMRIFDEVEKSLPTGDKGDRADFYREKLRAAFVAEKYDVVKEIAPLFLETAVDHAEALQNLGILYCRLGYDPETGKKYLIQALEEDDRLERAVEVLAVIYEHQGLEDMMMETVSRLGPENTRMEIMRAGIQRRDGHSEKAEEIFREILETHPDVKKWTPGEVEACVLYNQLLVDRGRFEESENLINLVEQFEGDSGPLSVMKARFLRGKKEFKASEDLLISAHRFDPERPDLRVVIAQAELYMDAGWDEKAERALKQALVMFPGLQPACSMMAKLAMKRGKPKEAEKWMKKLEPVNQKRLRKELKNEGLTL